MQARNANEAGFTMIDSLLDLIRRTDRDGNLSVDATLNAARQANEILSDAIENLERIERLDLEIGDLVETSKGGGVVKGFDAAGAIMVDLPKGEERFASDYFSASSVRKPSPEERLQQRVEALVNGTLKQGDVEPEDAIDVLEEIADTYRR